MTVQLLSIKFLKKKNNKNKIYLYISFEKYLIVDEI